MTGSVDVVLVDDHKVVRSGLRLILDREDDMRVVGEAADLRAGLDLARLKRPGVVVLDVHLGGATSLHAVPEFRSLGCRVVVLTMSSERGFVREALRARASAYVLKEAADSDLVEAIRIASRGESWVSPQLGAGLASAAEPDPLSPREVEVLALIGHGFTNREIANQLVLSVRTIESHRRSIQSKLDVSTRHELVELAIRRGLVGT